MSTRMLLFLTLAALGSCDDPGEWAGEADVRITNASSRSFAVYRDGDETVQFLGRNESITLAETAFGGFGHVPTLDEAVRCIAFYSTDLQELLMEISAEHTAWISSSAETSALYKLTVTDADFPDEPADSGSCQNAPWELTPKRE